MRTIGRPLYKTIGRVIGKGAHLGSKLNYPEFAIFTDSEDGTPEPITTDSEDGTIELILIDTEDR